MKSNAIIVIQKTMLKMAPFLEKIPRKGFKGIVAWSAIRISPMQLLAIPTILKEEITKDTKPQCNRSISS